MSKTYTGEKVKTLLKETKGDRSQRGDVRDKGMETAEGSTVTGCVIKLATTESSQHSHVAGPSTEPSEMHLPVSIPSPFLWLPAFPHS